MRTPPATTELPSAAFLAVRPRLLSCRLLDSLGARLIRIAPGTPPALLGAIAVAALSAFGMVALTLIERVALAPILLALVLASLTIGAGLYVVVWLFEVTTAELCHSFDPYLVTVEARKQAYDWFWQITDGSHQVRFALICSAGGIALAGLLDSLPHPPFPVYWSTYLALALAGFSLGQGAYLALVTPTGAPLLSQLPARDLGIFSPDPSKSPCLVGVSRILNAYAAVCAVMVTLCLLTIASLHPTWNDYSTRLLLATLLAGYSITSYVFVLPQIALALRLRREKDASLRALYPFVKETWDKLLRGDQGAWDILPKQLDLVTRLASVRASLVSFSAVRSYVGSLVAQGLAFAATQIHWSALAGWLSGQ